MGVLVVQWLSPLSLINGCSGGSMGKFSNCIEKIKCVDKTTSCICLEFVKSNSVIMFTLCLE